MSILIIHPKDTTTKFLKPIYAPLINKTIVTGGLNKSELRKLIETHVLTPVKSDRFFQKV
jgi:hypothetical protein